MRSRRNRDRYEPLSDRRFLVSWARLAPRLDESAGKRRSTRIKNGAPIAVAASILTIVYHMLRDGTCYRDLGPEYFARRNPAKLAAKLVNRMRNLGYHVEISAAA